MLKKNVIASLLLVSSMSVYANNNQDDKLYVSAGIANITVDTGVSSTAGVTIDEDDTAPMAMIGYKLDDNLAAEAGIFGTSEASASISASSSGTVRGVSYSASAAVKLSAETDMWMMGAAYHNQVNDKLNVTARAGMLFWDVDYKANVTITYNGSSVSAGGTFAQEDGNDAYFGLGADYSITDDIIAEASYLTSEVAGYDISSINIGIKHNF